MNNLEKIDHINSLNRARQKRFYDKNKERLNEIKRNLRVPTTVIPTTITDDSTPFLYNEDNVNRIVGEMEINKNTKRKHLSNIKIIFAIYPTQNLAFSLKHFDEIKTRLDNASQVQNPDKVYSPESRKGVMQTIWWVITKLNIPMNADIVKKYENVVSVLKQECIDNKREQMNDVENAVIPYTEYMNLIMNKYGNESMEYMITLLYNSITCRDNLASLLIVPAMRYADDITKNYIIIPKNGNTKIILNAYKTSIQYGKITVILPKDTANVVKKYIKTNNLTTFIFPKYQEGLTDVVSKMNKSIGLTGGINIIRRIKITDFLQNPNLSIDDKVRFATASMHSISQQEFYRYQQKSSS
jgi:hypothetical protein